MLVAVVVVLTTVPSSSLSTLLIVVPDGVADPAVDEVLLTELLTVVGAIALGEVPLTTGAGVARVTEHAASVNKVSIDTIIRFIIPP